MPSPVTLISCPVAGLARKKSILLGSKPGSNYNVDSNANSKPRVRSVLPMDKNHSVLVLDNFVIPMLTEYLFKAPFSDFSEDPTKNTGFPGPTAALPLALLEDITELLAPFVRDTFPFNIASMFHSETPDVQNTDGFASVLCSHRSDIPHFDFSAPEDRGLAAVLYVNVGPDSSRIGTGFFREKSTGMEAVLNEKDGEEYYRRYVDERRPAGELFEKPHEVEFEKNSIVKYITTSSEKLHAYATSPIHLPHKLLHINLR
ncbi:hypothetical protein TrVE_jg59 [Triparma verrucosa]|uniref:Uncharacterized protein n=1 Tax=Triparma verrucosa TaxID=1606542 RepID=A0A9W6ZB54_9STRA|nr:hypothetical protein TrVE_jg59 [Triparma verrucosa]